MSIESKKVVIIGGGVVGACTAYYLTKLSESSNQKISITIVEACSIACSSSGKSGGFLAKTWCDSLPIKPLTNMSYELHKQLNQELHGEKSYGYRKVTTLSVDANIDELTQGLHEKFPWLSKKCKISVIGTSDETAQLNPFEFTNILVEKSIQNGAELKIGKVKRIVLNKEKTKAIGVELENENLFIEADSVVLTMGAWSNEIYKLLDSNNGKEFPINSSRAHSVVFEFKDNCNKDEVPGAEVCFVDYKLNGKYKDFEIYPKSGNQLYICGESDKETLPIDAISVYPDELKCKNLEKLTRKLVSNLDKNYTKKKYQACYLPVSEVGVPIIGKLPGLDNVLVGCGHSCWGILNSPGTGLSIAQLIIFGVSKDVDISMCDPGVLLK